MKFFLYVGICHILRIYKIKFSIIFIVKLILKYSVNCDVNIICRGHIKIQKVLRFDFFKYLRIFFLSFVLVWNSDLNLRFVFFRILF